jgi:hypothetical protein
LDNVCRYREVLFFPTRPDVISGWWSGWQPKISNNRWRAKVLVVVVILFSLIRCSFGRRVDSVGFVRLVGCQKQITPTFVHWAPIKISDTPFGDCCCKVTQTAMAQFGQDLAGHFTPASASSTKDSVWTARITTLCRSGWLSG